MAHRRPSLRTVLVAAVALPLASGLVLVGVGVGSRSSRIVEAVSEARHREIGLRIRAELAPVLDAPHALNAANAELWATTGGLGDEALRRHLWRQLRGAPEVGYVQVGYALDGGFVGVERTDDGWRAEVSDPGRTGKGVWRLDESGEVEGERLEFVDGYDARQRPWYQAALAAGRPTWSPIYQFSSRAAPRLGITAVQPLDGPDGSLVGVLGADLVLAQLSDLLDPGELGEDARIALLERDGTLVASSVGPPFRADPAGKATRLRAEELGDATLAAAVRGLAAGDGLAGLRAERTFRVDAPDTLVFAAPLTDERGLDWVLVVGVPAGQVVGPLRDQVAGALLLGLLLMALATGGGVALASLVTDPIRQISAAAEAVARGAWTHPLPHTTATHEIQTLSRAFEIMRERVRTTLDDAQAARRVAEEGNRAKSTFLAGVSHELRTPLNAVIGYAELLLDDEDLSSRQRADVDRIRTSAGALLGLINDLLDLARLESGRVSLVVEDLDPAAVCRDVADSLRPVVAAGRNELRLELEPGLWVRTDRARLRQIVVNLVGNAAKFTSSGQVTVRARSEGDAVVIEVEDTGCGMRPELVPLIFRPFERLPGAERSEGTGLGLAIVARLLDAMGGRVEVHSEVGRGSRFSVHLASSAHLPGLHRRA